MFHFVEGDASISAEMQRIAQESGRKNAGFLDDRHDPNYDAAATALFNLLRAFADSSVFDASVIQSSTHKGTSGADNLSVPNPTSGATYILTDEGDDLVTTNFGNFTVVTGEGNDVLTLGQGSGWLGWIDESGSDTLNLTGITGASSLTVEFVEGWLYLGGQPKAGNQAAGDQASGVYFRPANGPEVINVGSSPLTLAQVIEQANSRPYIELPITPIIEAPFRGGYIGHYPGFDYDNDSLIISVMSVQGVGVGAAWWFDGPYLHTSTNYITQVTQHTELVIRVSDGSLHKDYSVVVEWRPDPFGGPEHAPFPRVEDEPSFFCHNEPLYHDTLPDAGVQSWLLSSPHDFILLGLL